MSDKSPHIQHHYEDGKHQYDAGKLGMWLFLAQEVLFFSALFVAYIVYRANHPEIFAYAHQYLDPNLGALNTALLILSSLTAAWAVRAAQLNQKKVLMFCLSATIALACGFLVIKYVEYSHKFQIGALYGKHFQPTEAPDGTSFRPPTSEDHEHDEFDDLDDDDDDDDGDLYDEIGPDTDHDMDHIPVELRPPHNTGMFFTIYFCMTGLHAIHVLAGIGIFIWLLLRARKDHFSDEYFGPVDYAALYWHLVDLIWIFLFPLLYLIH